MVHISGHCAFKDCDKPAIIEGYCAFHYNIISQQRNISVMSKMVELLGDMNSRLSNIETKLDPSNIVPSTSSVENITSNVIVKKKQTEAMFIPSFNISTGSDVEIKNMKTTESSKNILEIANQLKQTGGDTT